MNKFINLVYSQGTNNWTERARDAFEDLFGSGVGRYPDKAKKLVSIRAPEFRGGAGVTFAAIIHSSNPDSGAYGGMSLVVFPVEQGCCLLAMVVGTQGLSPDEEVLGRPGHGRKVAAICSWLNQKHVKGLWLPGIRWTRCEQTWTCRIILIISILERHIIHNMERRKSEWQIRQGLNQI